jgi:adenosine deaminase
MLDAGLNATINTDDPSISQIVLSNEYRLANEQLGVPLSTVRDQVFAAASAAFLPASERESLVESLRAEYQQNLPYL